MIALKVIAVFVLCCSLGANAQIKCLQGQTTPGQSIPGQPASRLISGSCPDDNYSCSRFDIDLEVTAVEGKFYLNCSTCHNNRRSLAHTQFFEPD